MLLYPIHLQLEENGTTMTLTDDPQQDSTVIGKELHVCVLNCGLLGCGETKIIGWPRPRSPLFLHQYICIIMSYWIDG